MATYCLYHELNTVLSNILMNPDDFGDLADFPRVTTTLTFEGLSEKSQQLSFSEIWCKLYK